jgi:L-lactate dehydrogenase complex protein LldG
MSSRAIILDKLSGSVTGVSSVGYESLADAFTETHANSAVERYIELAQAEVTTISEVQGWVEVPGVIAAYLQGVGLLNRIVIDTQAPIGKPAWSDSGIEVLEPPLQADGDTLLTDCYGAVAESGVLVISSNDGQAIANDFLAETHIVLLRKARIFPALADLWQSLRIESKDESKDESKEEYQELLPREFCLVAGPSRTADLGVPAKMGAHGPARVHVVIVDA